MSLDSALWYAGLAFELAVVIVLLQRRIFRSLPIFFVYTAWTVLGDAIGVVVVPHYPGFYNKFFFAVMPVDSLLQFGVIVELAWAVLRPIRSRLTQNLLVIVVAITLLCSLAAWPITIFTVQHDLPGFHRTLYRLINTFAFVRIIFFLALASFSQLLGISWRDRELQVATGLGFYSLVSMAAAILHGQMPSSVHYAQLNQIVAVSYIVSLIYWGWCFLQKAAPRQEFNPRMQSFLLSVAGTARAHRMALEDMRKTTKD